MECIKKNKGNFTNFPKTKKIFFPKPEQKPECAKGNSDEKSNILVITTDATGSPNTRGAPFGTGKLQPMNKV